MLKTVSETTHEQTTMKQNSETIKSEMENPLWQHHETLIVVAVVLPTEVANNVVKMLCPRGTSVTSTVARHRAESNLRI